MKKLLATTVFTLLAISAHAATFDAASPAFNNGKKLPDAQVGNQPGCNGPNISPAVTWKNLPAGTKSIAVTMFDQDAAKGAGYWHWVVYNIPPNTGGKGSAGGLPANAGSIEGGPLPVGASMGNNDAGQQAYLGACPPVGERAHRYVLTVWALGADVLPQQAGLSGTAFKGYLDKYALGSKNLMAKYGRDK